MPKPGLADLAVETAIQWHRTWRASLDPDARVGEFRGAELSRVVEGEIRADDLDATQSYVALRRARCRAAFARLPQVAMSHQRRAAFFVPSKKTRAQRGSAQRRTRGNSPRMSASAADSTIGIMRPANASPTGTN